ncbi:farnesol dehydrogenase-like [Leptidea sinapis]|uniref:farnesol dehydrogenase-like n=1 Tax=Leptidea sinapis TaxID=189913 RepID=UPI002129BC93|nr:farnesol dehydrogenase-like [Leptidea sinapis]
MERWNGKTAVVTGASSGIGATVAVRLADAGMRVVGLARRSDLVDDLKASVTGSGSIHSVKCDVAKAQEIAAVFELIEREHGCVHVLVNNAGVIYKGSITEMHNCELSDEQILSTIDINLSALILCNRYALKSMRKHSFDGHIININSMAGHYVPFNVWFNVYTTSKHAVTTFTTSLQCELAQANSAIKVTSISPGLVRTSITEGAENLEGIPMLETSAVADSLLHVLATPPTLNITELTLMHVGEKRL